MGIIIFIDDFGIGYLNLVYLCKFNVFMLKIDCLFIYFFISDDNDVLFVQVMIIMVFSLGMYIIVEGIEDEVIKQMLIEMGCQLGQGYYWFKLLNEQEIIDKLCN